MDVVNQHNVWVLGMVAGCGTIGSFIIAFIVNRDKLWDFVKKYWLLVPAMLALGGLWAFYEFGGFGWIANLWHGFAKWMSSGVPMWFVLALVGALMGIQFLIRTIRKQRKAMQGLRPRREAYSPIEPKAQVPASAPEAPATPELSKEDFRVEHYLEDLIDGVWWIWSYSGNTVNVPKPLCPNRHCQCDLFFREDYDRPRYNANIYTLPPPPVSLHCPRCNFKQDFDNDEPHVLNGVSQEILSRIRTGRFRGILYSRAKNQQAGNN
jgi:hypothetical protein